MSFEAIFVWRNEKNERSVLINYLFILNNCMESIGDESLHACISCHILPQIQIQIVQ
jgi:hypothetical protein